MLRLNGSGGSLVFRNRLCSAAFPCGTAAGGEAGIRGQGSGGSDDALGGIRRWHVRAALVIAD
jgi:hypothetical protein